MTAVNPQPTFTLGDRLRRTRLDAHLSTAAMARLLYLGRNVVNNWEKDNNRPTDLKLRHWAEIIAMHTDFEVEALFLNLG